MFVNFKYFNYCVINRFYSFISKQYEIKRKI